MARETKVSYVYMYAGRNVELSRTPPPPPPPPPCTCVVAEPLVARRNEGGIYVYMYRMLGLSVTPPPPPHPRASVVVAEPLVSEENEGGICKHVCRT